MSANIFGIDLGTNNIKIYNRQSDDVTVEKNLIAIQNKINIFAYGNLGKFTTRKAPNYSYSTGTINNVAVNGDTTNLQNFSNVWVMNNYYDTLVEFERQVADFNPLLSKYVENYYDLYSPFGAAGYFDNMTNIRLNNGLINGVSPSYVYGMYAVPGTIQSSYSIGKNDQIAVNVNGAMTLGRGDNSHDIKLGFQFEMQNNSGMSYSATTGR